LLVFKGKAGNKGRGKIFYLHVLQVFVEQVVHASEEALRRLLPPPIPKEEKSFCMFLLPQDIQETFFSPLMETSVSK
jgi:hypothetical protein